jgi:L-asparagine transporter-like permease
MSKRVMWLAEYVWANLGRCSLCARKAFLSAVAACIITVVINATLEQSIWLLMSTVCACLLTSLWIAHILAFTIKSSTGRSATENVNPARRAVLSVFVKTAAAAAFASALPTLSYAQTGHDCAGIGKCPVGAPYCCAKSCGLGRTAYACCASANCLSSAAGSCVVPC